MKFRWKIPVDIEYENNKQKLEKLIAEKNGYNTTTRDGPVERIQTTIQNSQSEDEKKLKNFPTLFENNRAKKCAEINIQLKPGIDPVKQKARPILLHLKEGV